MHHDYADIRSRIAEPPVWFDEYAVPRYEPFSPRKLADIYASECCLLAIECQNCGAPFRVAMSVSSHDLVLAHLTGGAAPSIREQIADQTLHYGDPPNVRCCASGPTMNSVPTAVLEYWIQDEVLKWQRHPEHEVAIVTDWASDRPFSDPPTPESTSGPWNHGGVSICDDRLRGRLLVRGASTPWLASTDVDLLERHFAITGYRLIVLCDKALWEIDYPWWADHAPANVEVLRVPLTDDAFGIVAGDAELARDAARAVALVLGRGDGAVILCREGANRSMWVAGLALVEHFGIAGADALAEIPADLYNYYFVEHLRQITAPRAHECVHSPRSLP